MTTLRDASWAAARSAALSVATRLNAESVAVTDLDTRVLASDVHARGALPSFDSSAMDGWAVSGSSPWRIVGDVSAGHPHAGQLSPGQAVRMATGGVVPRGGDAVLRWEDAHVENGVVTGTVQPGTNIRPAGEECRVGDLLAQAGTDISPALAGFLAATGHDHVDVTRRPRVAVILLGDELLTSGVPTAGRVRDSLGPQLPGWIARAGAEVVLQHQVSDDPDSLPRVLADVADSVDVVITTGGTADGPRDHVRAAIAERGGELIIDRVSVRPGHPMLLASLPGSHGQAVPLVSLPGNPHSAIVGFVTLAVPVIDSMLGRPVAALSVVRAGEDLRSPAQHTRLIAGNVVDGVFQLSPYGGSAMLRGLAQSSGFAVVDQPLVPSGASVEWLPLP